MLTTLWVSTAGLIAIPRDVDAPEDRVYAVRRYPACFPGVVQEVAEMQATLHTRSGHQAHHRCSTFPHYRNSHFKDPAGASGD